MSGGNRIEWTEGLALAQEVAGLLEGTYTRLAIAGSIRRGKADVGDIELVLRPAINYGVNKFELRTDKLLMDRVFAKRLNKRGHTIAWANRQRSAVYKGFAVDMFIVLPDRQWGPTMVIRTGPGDANQVLVTADDITNSDGNRGVLPAGIKWDKGVLIDTGDGVILDTPEEEDVFAACGLPWLPPDYRTVARYQAQAAVRSNFSYQPHSTGLNQHFDRAGRYLGIPRDAISVGGKPYWAKLPAPVVATVEDRPPELMLV